MKYVLCTSLCLCILAIDLANAGELDDKLVYYSFGIMAYDTPLLRSGRVLETLPNGDVRVFDLSTQSIATVPIADVAEPMESFPVYYGLNYLTLKPSVVLTGERVATLGTLAVVKTSDGHAIALKMQDVGRALSTPRPVSYAKYYLHGPVIGRGNVVAVLGNGIRVIAKEDGGGLIAMLPKDVDGFETCSETLAKPSWRRRVWDWFQR